MVQQEPLCTEGWLCRNTDPPRAGKSFLVDIEL